MSSSYNELSYESPYVSPLSNHAYIICEIIRYLNRQVDLVSCCQVSKLWNTCAIPSLWRSPKIKHISTLTKFVRTLVRTHQGITMYSYGCMIQHLDLSRVNLACESAELGLIAETCGVLKSINLTNVQHLSEEILSRFSSRCSDLRSLTLLNLPYIADKSMINVITRCHRLEHLAFGDCLGIKDQSILQLAYSAKNLTTLEIFFKNKIENDSFILITKNCMRLKNIHIWECELLSDAAITTMAINLNTRLESLILHNIKNITDVSLTQVAVRCTNLRNLGLEPYEGVTNETLIAFADYAKKLESFEISLNKAQNISNDGFIAIADGSKQLSKVTFQSSTLNVTDITLNIMSVRSATTLTCLHLYNCSFSDSAFTVLEKARPPINDLCLFTLPNITDDPIIRFLYSISNTLTSLQLSNCESITEECVVSGVSECKLLKKLSLYLSNDFTTRGLDAIVKLRDNLKELSLASIEDIPSEAAAPKLASLRNLGELRIRDCSNLKPDDVLTICCGCHQLEEFFFGCGNYITEEFVQEYNYYGKNRPLLVIGPET